VEARDDLGFAGLAPGVTQHVISAEEALEQGVPSFAELIAGL
jgi:hypothetical protein